jgi:hypothetical protein
MTIYKDSPADAWSCSSYVIEFSSQKVELHYKCEVELFEKDWVKFPTF